MTIASPSAYPYQVGGSLRADAPSYITRQADQQLYEALVEGKFCYIFNARQIGKSSLRVRTKSRLEAEGYRCAAIDMTSIGSEAVTSPQWYKGITAELWRAFDLGSLQPFNAWWQEQADNASVQVLLNFFEQILFVQIPGEIVIFLDEIDSILNLSFPVNDFFAWIRFCYDHRSESPHYQRLTFVLLGVTTPSDLIDSWVRTPFNIGEAIDLSGFNFQEALPLAQGLRVGDYNSQALLQAILDWTGGQPFLTQKICQLVVKKAATYSAELTPIQLIEQLVLDNILSDWKQFDQPQHFRSVRDRLLANPKHSGRLLGLYRSVLLGKSVRINDSREQLELLLSGLLVRRHGQLQVKCKLYREVFNLDWVQRNLEHLRPYAETIQAWEVDPDDESRLLRGKVLTDAQAWAKGQQLGDDEHRFLAASEALDRRLMEESLQLTRAQEIAQHLKQEKKSNRRQRRLIIGLTGLLAISFGLGAYAIKSQQETLATAVRAKVDASESSMMVNRRLDALVSALQAEHKLKKIAFAPPDLIAAVHSALRKAVFRSVERNRLIAEDEVRSVDISPDSRWIAAADATGKIYIWHASGQLHVRFQDPHLGNGIFGLKFSPDGQQFATASDDGSIKLWDLQGKLLMVIPAHAGAVQSVVFSPDGQNIISASADQTVKIWNRQGKLLHTLRGHHDEVWGLAVSADGQLIASGSRDRTVKLWNQNGQLLNTLTGYRGAVRGLAFSPNSQTLVTGCDDHMVRIWNRNGELMTAYQAHDAAVQAVAYAPNGKFFVTVSWDHSWRLWSPEGLLLTALPGHEDRIWTVAFAPDSRKFITGSWDLTVRVWQQHDTLTTPLVGHTAAVLSVAYSPDGKTIASTSDDRTVRLWNPQGAVQQILREHQGETYSVAFSPNGAYLVSGSLDRTLKLWNRQGQWHRTFTGHRAEVWSVAFSPDGQQIASASFDSTVRLWNLQGTLLKEFQVPAVRMYRVAFSPDGELIATASSDGIARIWSITGELRATLKGHQAIIQSVSFSPDGQTLATASSDNTIKLWQLDGKLIRTIPAHTKDVSDVQFSPNGQLMASASFDGSIKLWRLDGTLVSTLEGHQTRVWRVAWSPNGRQLASVGEDKLVLVWDLAKVESDNFVEDYACRWLQDYLQNNPLLTPTDRKLCQK